MTTHDERLGVTPETRVIVQGGPAGYLTQVTDLEGNVIPGITSLTINCDARDWNTVSLEMRLANVKVEAQLKDVTVIQCPCGETHTIEH